MKTLEIVRSILNSGNNMKMVHYIYPKINILSLQYFHQCVCSALNEVTLRLT